MRASDGHEPLHPAKGKPVSYCRRYGQDVSSGQAVYAQVLQTILGAYAREKLFKFLCGRYLGDYLPDVLPMCFYTRRVKGVEHIILVFIKDAV